MQTLKVPKVPSKEAGNVTAVPLACDVDKLHSVLSCPPSATPKYTLHPRDPHRSAANRHGPARGRRDEDYSWGGGVNEPITDSGRGVAEGGLRSREDEKKQVEMGERKVKWSLMMWMVGDRRSSGRGGGGAEGRHAEKDPRLQIQAGLKGSRNWVGKVQLHREESHDGGER